MMPPMPPVGAVPAAPTYASLAGDQGQGGFGADAGSAGAGQVGTALVKIAVEVDQALKMLGKSAPSMAPWVLKTTLELQQQISTALQDSRSQLTNTGAPDNVSFPDGSSRISGMMG